MPAPSGYKVPTDQIYEFQMQSTKGMPAEYQLDKILPRAEGSDPIYAGMVTSIDGNSGFTLGCTGLNMAFFAFKGAGNLDAGSVPNPRNEWQMGNGPETVTAVAAISPCELRTWAFTPNPDVTDSDTLLASVPGAYLVSNSSGYLAAPGGTGSVTANLVAMVSSPIELPHPIRTMNRHRLPFYPVHLPARAAS